MKREAGPLHTSQISWEPLLHVTVLWRSMHTHTMITQKMPTKYESKIAELHRNVINARTKLGQTGNIDEVALTFDIPSYRTIDNKGCMTITIKISSHEKTHYTVVFVQMAQNCLQKRCLMIKFHRELCSMFKKKVEWMKTGWGSGWRKCELNVLVAFWGREKTIHSCVRPVQTPHNRSHENEVKDLNSQFQIIPGGLTSQLQPLDVSINKPFKVFMHKEWTKWMSMPNHHLTPTGQWKG